MRRVLPVIRRVWDARRVRTLLPNGSPSGGLVLRDFVAMISSPCTSVHEFLVLTAGDVGKQLKPIHGVQISLSDSLGESVSAGRPGSRPLTVGVSPTFKLPD